MSVRFAGLLFLFLLTSCRLSDNTLRGDLFSNIPSNQSETDSIVLPTMTSLQSVGLGTLQYSDIVQLSDLTQLVDVSISGGGAPEYRICSDGSSDTQCTATLIVDWTSSSQSSFNIRNKFIQARLTSSTNYLEELTAQIAIANKTIHWTVKSRPGVVKISSSLATSGQLSYIYMKLIDQGVLYLQDEENTGFKQLFIADYNGQWKHKISPSDLETNLSIGQLHLNSTHIFYKAKVSSLDYDVIFKVSLEDFSIEVITPPMASGRVITSISLSPSGNILIMRSDKDDVGVFDQYSMTTSGANLTRLSQGIGSCTNEFAFVNSESRIYYICQASPSRRELYYSDIGVSGFTMVSPGDAGADNGANEIHLSPDGQKIVYSYERNGDDKFLYSINIDGSNNVQLSNTTTEPGYASHSILFKPGSNEIVYRLGISLSSGDRVASATVGTASSEVILTTAPAVNGLIVGSVTYSTDMTRVFYSANHENTGNYHIYSAEPGVANSSVLLTPIVDNLLAYLFKPLSGKDALMTDDNKLYLVTAGVSGRVLLQPGGNNYTGSYSSLASDLSNFLFKSDFAGNGQQLYRWDLPSNNLSVALNQSSIVLGGDVGSILRVSDSLTFYLADDDTDTINELYLADINLGFQGKVNPAVTGSITMVSNIKIGSNNYLVYVGDDDSDTVNDAFVYAY